MLNHFEEQAGPPESTELSAGAICLASAEEDGRVLYEEEEALVSDVRAALTLPAGVRRMLGSREGAGPGRAAQL